MKCPYCNGLSFVKDTVPDDDTVIRKRQCKKCGKIFYTQENDLDFNNGKKIMNKTKNKIQIERRKRK